MKVSRIDLEVRMTPSDSFISVKGSLDINQPDQDLEFFLNRALTWETLQACQDDKRIKVELLGPEEHSDSFLEVAKVWRVLLPPKTRNMDSITLIFEYSGRIVSDKWGTNYLTPECAELACYVAWYPIRSLEDQPPFRVFLNGPEDWIWLMNASEFPCEHTHCWQNSGNAIDLTLLGRPGSRSISHTPGKHFWGETRYYDQFKSLEEDLDDIERRLREWLGPSDRPGLVIALVPRDSGGAYVRQNLIVYQDTIPEEYFTTKRNLLLLSWAHEICHLWFNKAPTTSYHNWIDEALADYCALLLSEEKFGSKFFETRLQRVKDMIREAGKLSVLKTITRSHENAEIVYYKWGSLILHEIRQKISLDVFRRVIRDFAQRSRERKVITTEDFIDSLTVITGESWNSFMEERLSSVPRVD